MRERPELILKFVCVGLGVALFIRFVWIIWTANPLAHVVVPDLPSLADESTATNQNQVIGGTTTSSSMNSTKQLGTNQAVAQTNSAAATNLQARVNTASKAADFGTKARPSHAGTNANANEHLAKPGTPPPNAALATGLTNSAVSTNSPIAKRSGHRRRGQFADAVGMGFMPGGPGAKKTTVTPAIQASIDRIVDSEILGPVIRPLPMALLGIAGNEAFLRGPDGQTGLVKEGDALGDIKLLRIGTNRVLIEQDGQKKELTIFDGIGGETLLNKSSQDSNENKDP